MNVKEFKEHIAASVSIPSEKQRLIYQGRVLQDDKKLQEYSKGPGDAELEAAVQRPRFEILKGLLCISFFLQMLGERLSTWWNGLLLRLSFLLEHLLGQALPQLLMVGHPCPALGALGPLFMTGMPTAMSWLEPSIFL